MDNSFEKDGININHQHKTWTPDDQIKYEKEMIMFRIKICTGLIAGTILLFGAVSLITSIFRT